MQRGTGAADRFGLQGMAGLACAEEDRPALRGASPRAVPGLGHYGSDRLAQGRIPLADHSIGAAGEKRPVVSFESQRPYRKTRSHETGPNASDSPIEDGDPTSEARRGRELAVLRHRE